MRFECDLLMWSWKQKSPSPAEITNRKSDRGVIVNNDAASHLFCRSQKSPQLPQPQTTSWKHFSSLCVKTFPDFVEISRFCRFRVDSSFSAQVWLQPLTVRWKLFNCWTAFEIFFQRNLKQLLFFHSVIILVRCFALVFILIWFQMDNTR